MARYALWLMVTNIALLWCMTVVSGWWLENPRPIRLPKFISQVSRKSPNISFSTKTRKGIYDDDNNQKRIQRKISLFEKDRNKIKESNVVSRTVPITSNWSVTVWEWANPAAVVETYWQVEQQCLTSTCPNYEDQQKQQQQSKMLDPFGLVAWPGAVIAAQELLSKKKIIENRNVLVLGAGVGIEAQAAAILGASHVLATDIHPTTSLRSSSSFDVMVFADVLYNEKLAMEVARLCQEARCSKNPPIILISDSQRFVNHFETELNERLNVIGETHRVTWIPRDLPKFTGSGVLINNDQTYDVKARFLWIGLPHSNT